MQRVLSCFSKDKKPPFSQQGLDIPEKDKLRMKIESRRAVSFSWADAKRIADAVRKLDGLDETRKKHLCNGLHSCSRDGTQVRRVIRFEVE